MSSGTLRIPGLEGLDLDAYLARVGFQGARAPTLATLAELQRRHVGKIAFENLSSLAGLPVPLDLGSLQAKLVQGRRGGYCFEQNLLFAAVLQRLGFAVTGLAARVVWNAPPGATNPRSHMLLRVALPEGPYITDVGFGGASLPGPLALVADVEQATPIEPYRLVVVEDGFRLEVRLGEEWKPVYVFDPQPQQVPDYEAANWYVATHPASRFVQCLMAARPSGTRRQTLLDGEFSLRELDGTLERRRLASAAELRAVLTRVFGIDVPADARVDAALERVVARR